MEAPLYCGSGASHCGGFFYCRVYSPGPGLQELWYAGSTVAAHGLKSLDSVVVPSWAELLWGMWNFPEPGIKPMSPALAARFLSTVPPGKSRDH